MRRSTLTMLSAIALLSACKTQVGGVPAAPTGVQGMITEPVFNTDGTLIDPRGDADGDGIPNQDEVTGYQITVDVNGFAVVASQEQLEVRTVTSDPRYRDTDGDGVDDHRERMVKSDPRRADTDGDTLSDRDELDRWHTSPVSIDSDGDARGGDPANPRPPNFALFDAAELRLARDPANPSGPFVPGIGATNPNDKDTDGDGLNDYEELYSGLRRSTIAELPSVGIRMTPGSDITIGFTTQTAQSRVDTSSFSLTRGTSDGLNTSISTLSETLVQMERTIGTYVRERASAGCCLDILSSETEIGVRSRAKDRLEQTISVDTTIGYDRALHELEERTRTAEDRNEITITGGVVRMSVDVSNNGLVPFRLSDMAFNLYVNDRAQRGMRPLTELVADSQIVLSPGERRTLSLSRTDIEIEPTRALVHTPSRLNVAPARFNLLDANNVNTGFRQEDVRARCAHFVINFGDGRVRSFDVATPTYERGAVATVGRLLREVGVDHEARLVPGLAEPFYQIRIEDKDTELHRGAAQPLTEALPYTARSGGPGPRLVKRGWFAMITRRDRTNATGEFFANLFDGPVYAGDIVTLIYSTDNDRDGLSEEEERMYGSSDRTPHSDTDGLSDFWEVRESWIVPQVGVVDYLAAPHPAQNDFDGDGLSDVSEAIHRTDPRSADTDDDGLSDPQELDARYNSDPTRREDARPMPTATCTARSVFPSRPVEVLIAAVPPSGGPRRFISRDNFATTTTCRWGDRFALGCRYATIEGANYYVPQEVFNDAVNPDPMTGASRARCGGWVASDNSPASWDCTVRTPTTMGSDLLGGSRHCVVFYQHTTGLKQVGSDLAGSSWTVLPCSAFRDADGDGVCESIPALVGHPIERELLENARNYGPYPTCATLNVGTRPQLTLSINATDPEGDLTRITLRRSGGAVGPNGGMMQFTFAPVARWNEAIPITDACNVDPASFEVQVSDAFGLSTSTRCAFEGGQRCER